MLKGGFSKLSALRRFVGPRVWRHFVASMLLGLLTFGVETSAVFVLQAFLAALGLTEGALGMVGGFVPESGLTALLMLVAFGILRALVFYAGSMNGGLVTQTFIREIRGRLFSKALRHAGSLSLSETLACFGDRLIESGQVLMFAARVVTSAISSFLIFLLLGRVSLFLLLCALGLLLLLFLPLGRLGRHSKDAGKAWTSSVHQATAALLVGVKNHFLLKIYGQTEGRIQAGRDLIEGAFGSYRKYLSNSSLQRAYPMFAGTVVVGAVTFLNQRSPGVPGVRLIGFLYLFLRFAQSMGEILNCASAIRFGMPSLRALRAWEESLGEVSGPHRPPLPGGQSVSATTAGSGPVAISAGRVCFRYPEATDFLLEGLSFEVRPGEMLLVQGPSGAGKSTLLALILGLMPPTSGSLQINGRPASEVGPLLFDSVAYVGPEPYLVEGSVRENLLFGHPAMGSTVPEAELYAALEQARLASLVRGFPRGLDQKLDDFAKISTGQKQRLALARAFLRKPRLLILDEATANLDPETETLLVSEIAALKGAATIVVISHRDVFSHLSDVSVVLRAEACPT